MINRKWQINGHIKEIGYCVFDKQFREPASTNLLHNRINVYWKPEKSISAAVEIRNRFYWGNPISNTPGFSNLLRNENEWLNC